MFDFVINPVQSPCKNCTKRFVGCHTAENCKEWGEYRKKADAYLETVKVETMLNLTRGSSVNKYSKRHTQPNTKSYN